ncbi:TylF/MycF/NovP-related O-methyltransferase [Sorangium sp. So ce1153]|uniref:TylF/MycF/NovP-related O-methyltransferase n=1 Tax=Sorangium sp. So ce1153 TaxID=3133333 RepID=UPI003F622E0A
MDLLLLGALFSARVANNRGYLRELLARMGGEFRSPHLAKLWPLIEDRTLLDPFRGDAILTYAERALDKPGDLAECGAFRGGISLLLASLLRELGVRKRVHVLDSFEGLPAPNPAYDFGYAPGEFQTDEAQLVRRIEELGLSDHCVIRRGWFAETLPALAADHELCFVHIDCDLHDSVVACLDHLYPRVAEGAPIVFDDYSDGAGGVMTAVDRWAARTGEVIHLGPAPQATIVKGLTPLSGGVSWFRAEDAAGPAYSVEHLREHAVYARFLERVQAMHEDRLADFGRFVALCTGGASGPQRLRAPGYQDWLRALFGG